MFIKDGLMVVLVCAGHAEVDAVRVLTDNKWEFTMVLLVIASVAFQDTISMRLNIVSNVQRVSLIV